MDGEPLNQSLWVVMNVGAAQQRCVTISNETEMAYAAAFEGRHRDAYEHMDRARRLSARLADGLATIGNRRPVVRR